MKDIIQRIIQKTEVLAFIVHLPKETNLFLKIKKI